MPKKNIIKPAKSPPALGPYNHAVRIGDLLFCAGQIPIDPATGNLVTGDINVIDKQHFEMMKDGAIVANSGHFNVEINIPSLEKLASEKRLVRPFVEQYFMADGRRINILGQVAYRLAHLVAHIIGS